MASAALQTLIAAKRSDPYTPENSVEQLRRELATKADISLPEGRGARTRRGQGDHGGMDTRGRRRRRASIPVHPWRR